jgi:hypothetical protein
MKQTTNRLSILIVIAFAGLMAGCGSSVSSSTQPGSNQVFTLDVTPTQLTLNSGDWSTITAVVDLSVNNGTPKPVTPQPTFKFFSSDPRVTVSPAGEVCAGQWDARFLVCSPSSTLPSGFVTVSAYNASHNISGSVLVSVHPRAARIALSADPISPNPAWAASSQPWPTGALCISQTNQVKFVAQPVDANGNPINSCTANPGTAGCVNDNDYVWTTDNSSVAAISSFGFVRAQTPGVANVFATLNGTVSQPLAFVTCPPTSIVLSTSDFTGTNPAPPFTTTDVTLNAGGQKYVTATLKDINGNPLITSPLTYVTSDPLTGSFGPPLELSYPSATPGGAPLTEPTALLTANTAGRFGVVAACAPPSCNPAVADFVTPSGPETGQAVGFGYPVYSNVVGATVQGTTGSNVLVTGTTFSDGVTPAHRLLVYDSEALALIQTVELANLPNSLVVAPNGANAYVGSSAGLMVVNLATFQSSLHTFPINGQPNTAVVSGTVLGVSPDSRYVVVSDLANSFVFLIDTTVTKAATRYNLANIDSVTFAADGSNIWIGGAAGVFVFQADTFVPITTNQTAHVTSLAWMPDGQSYFASGDQLVTHSTCENKKILPLPSPNLVSTVPEGLSTTAIDGVPHLLGLDGNLWFDYPVTTSAQVPLQTVQAIGSLVANGSGDVCLSTVSVNAPITAAAGLLCTAQQVSFSPKLEEEFVTGLNPSCAGENVIHGYDVVAQAPFACNTTNAVVPLSGGVLNDGRKLYFGSFDSSNNAILHRIDLSTCNSAPGTIAEDDAVSVAVVPSFVAVVPK